MNTDFDWTRIAFAMALMGIAFIALPAFFLWHDNRKDERERAHRADGATPPLSEDPNR